MMKKFAFVLLLFFLVEVVNAQLFERVYYVSGRVLDADTKKPVPYVLIVNVKKGNATQSDTAGRFLISMTKNDTLRLSSLGYYTTYWTLSDKQVRGKKYETVIYMKRRTYELPEVDVFAVRWKAFLYQISHTEVPKDETQERIQQWFNKAVSKEDLKAIRRASIGVGFVFGGKTKYEKQLEKIQELQRYEELEQRAYQKFNPQLVSTITGLQGEELEKFMDYLNFDRDFILKTPQYDLIEIIKEIYEEYKKGNLPDKSKIIRRITPFAPKKL